MDDKAMSSTKNSSNRHKKNYRIIRIEDDAIRRGMFKKPYPVKKKVLMKKFYAKDDADAYEYLKNYRKCANKQYTYYFDKIHITGFYDSDGVLHEREDCYDFFNETDANSSSWKKLKNDVSFWLWRIFISIPSDIKFGMKNLWYMFRTGHRYQEKWSLDIHILDDIIWNVSRLINESYGVSQHFIDLAIAKEHEGEKDFDIDKWKVDNGYDVSNECMDSAIAIRNAEYENVIKYIKIYKYYSNFGIVDMNDPDEVEFDRTWHHTLPIVLGTYDQLDYERLTVLTTKYWNKIWEWMRKYGQTLWD